MSCTQDIEDICLRRLRPIQHRVSVPCRPELHTFTNVWLKIELHSNRRDAFPRDPELNPTPVLGGLLIEHMLNTMM